MNWTDIITPPNWTEPRRCASCGGMVKMKSTRIGTAYEIHVIVNKNLFRLFRSGQMVATKTLADLESILNQYGI